MKIFYQSVLNGRDAGEPHLASSLGSESVLRMQYAMVIVRLVNGVTDSGQKGRLATSVAGLASAAGKHSNLLHFHEPLQAELKGLRARTM